MISPCEELRRFAADARSQSRLRSSIEAARRMAAWYLNASHAPLSGIVRGIAKTVNCTRWAWLFRQRASNAGDVKPSSLRRNFTYLCHQWMGYSLRVRRVLSITSRLLRIRRDAQKIHAEGCLICGGNIASGLMNTTNYWQARVMPAAFVVRSFLIRRWSIIATRQAKCADYSAVSAMFRWQQLSGMALWSVPAPIWGLREEQV